MKTVEATILMALCGVFLVLTAPLARATTLAQLSLDQLAHAAHAIVRAHAISSLSVWHDGEIWTITTFRVEENWKGRASQQIQVWIIGGQAGRITSYVPGAPRFRPSEEAVLFLEPTRDGEISITAWQEGTFRIHLDSRTRETRVTQDSEATPEFALAGHKASHGAIRDWPIAKFKERVMQALASERGAK